MKRSPHPSLTEHSRSLTQGKKKWIVYLSRDRRVLWAESTNPDDPVPKDALQSGTPDPDDAYPPGLAEWNRLLDIAMETRMPQYGLEKMTMGDLGERLYSIKIFPDLTLDGDFRGLIQVIEECGADGGYRWDKDIKQTINALLDLTLGGVLLFSPDRNRILNVNRRVAQLTGYTVSELQGMPGCSLFGESGVKMLQNLFDRMVIAGESMLWGQTLTLRDNYGSLGRYLCSLRTIPERPGPDAPLAMYIAVDPIPNAHNDQLAPNPGLLASAFRDNLWEYDAEAGRFHYSKAFAHIFGAEGAEGEGKDTDEWEASVHPDDSEKIAASWRKLLKKGERYSLQYRYRDVEGNWRWILSTIHAVLNDSHGRLTRTIGFQMDITDSMEANMSLVDAEERLRLVIDNAGIGIAVAGLDGEIQQINPALAAMLGWDRAELEGKTLIEFAHPEDRQTLRDVLSRMKRGGRRENIPEQRFARPDGSMVWVTLTATMSKKALEGDRYIILMAEDVTERHARQTKLQFDATHDVMTGAWNRWVLMERLEQHINLAKRHVQPMAFCICDLDLFKTVNDAHGHQAGDQVLVQFVKMLTETVRDTEVVGRYGGEEFGIVFPNTTPEGAAFSMERTRQLLDEHQFTACSDTPFHVTASFGIAGVSAESTLKSVVAEADAALYVAKQKGRNRVVIHGHEDEESVSE